LQLGDFESMRLEFISGHYSKGYGKQAKVLIDAGNQAYAYLIDFFQKKPEVELLVLDAEDWKRLKLPQKYEHGPFFKPYHTPHLVYYSSDVPEFWRKGLFTLCNAAPQRLKEEFLSTIRQEGRDFKSSFFQNFNLNLFSLTIVHEFTHVFCETNHIFFQIISSSAFHFSDLAWFTEFFCQYVFYSFLKKSSDEYAKKWFLIGKICYEGGKSLVKYTNLRCFGKQYKEMVSMPGATNLFWYQYGKFMLMAEELYQRYGENFLKKTIDEMEYGEEFFIRRIQHSLPNFESWFQNWK